MPLNIGVFSETLYQIYWGLNENERFTPVHNVKSY